MVIKQNQQEFESNYKKLFESLKPAILLDGDSNSKPNVQVKVEASATLLRSYMLKNFTDANGVTDFSLANLRACVAALTDDLAWSIPPKHFGASQRASQRDAANALGLGHHKTEFDRPELNKPQKSIYDQQREEKETARRNKAAVETEAIISGHRGRTHARTQAECGLLRAERDRWINAKTDPEAIRDAVQKKAREMEPSALGS